MSKPVIVAMDLEGVLVPEIWINVAERTGIEALRRDGVPALVRPQEHAEWRVIP